MTTRRSESGSGGSPELGDPGGGFGPDSAERAEELFGEFLAERSAAACSTNPGPVADRRAFEALAAEHPEVASELHSLFEDALELARLRGRIAASEGVRDERLIALLDQLASTRDFFERFELEGEIGAGGQGRVVEALERSLGRRVAIKRLRPELTEELGLGARDHFVARFLAEAQITAQLDHPGVCAVHELAVDEQGQPYFTMSRVRGDELSEVFRRSHAGHDEWPRVRCLTLLLRVCETLSFAHSRGVVHRDLKPSNVMVGSFGEVFVMDWGLARVAADSSPAAASPVPVVQTVRDRAGADSLLATQPSGNLGTLYYMAPEAARDGAVGATAAVDVYALGAMLYELVSGRPPYWTDDAGATAEQVLAQIQAKPPAKLGVRVPDAPVELVAICDRAMARLPAERYADMTALADDLRAYLEERVVRAHATGAWAELRKWFVRNRRLAVALGLVLLTTIAGLVAVAAVQSEARKALDLEADLYRLPYLEEEAERLWPELPERIPAYEAWIAQAERLAGRLGRHEGELRRLRATALSSSSDEVTFAEPTDQLRHETLAATVERLATFARPEGLLDQVRGRLSWARSVEERTLRAPRFAWDTALAALAKVGGPYDGLDLTPRLGLVPLGPDPASGFQEFAFPRSGVVPRRAADGALRIDEASALVFVLVPGGTFSMGAQSADPAAPGYDRFARPEEGPVHDVSLDPFWIAKHELTQGQWARLGGGRPSFITTEAEGGRPDRHPVEGVSWSDCIRLLARFELTLPTEAQWEYAARAGTTGPFLGGGAALELDGAVNLADRTVIDAGLGWPQAVGMDWLDDGFIRHAPVGSFGPNAFGLHDVLGNVWEWCLDPPGAYSEEVEAGTGLRIVDTDPPERIARGGGFINNAAFARTAIRDLGRSRDFDSSYHGVRPVLR